MRSWHERTLDMLRSNFLGASSLYSENKYANVGRNTTTTNPILMNTTISTCSLMRENMNLSFATAEWKERMTTFMKPAMLYSWLNSSGRKDNGASVLLTLLSQPEGIEGTKEFDVHKSMHLEEHVIDNEYMDIDLDFNLDLDSNLMEVDSNLW
eukprot:CAMPEP_0184863402 /NCGR_PEP_ID=MMETSP0580-20130426/10925_1 /TAXON_ID=1118495 /ORGANISM="Dactyliosolen fragilissimus" /LENGTH=152 /DNA_ID=CAMNT_0027361709 /DNA_START=188 /DNA_END=643 /DNA_ORIENTATION=+